MCRGARKLAPYTCKPIAPKKLGARKRAGRQRCILILEILISILEISILILEISILILEILLLNT